MTLIVGWNIEMNLEIEIDGTSYDSWYFHSNAVWSAADPF